MTIESDAQAAFAATLVDEWVRGGVTDAVVAPGSRSTPLLVALAADGRLRLHVVLDERSAGFVALGLGLATGRPAVVVTTSGTAAVELHPAMVEGHQAGVPMIAVTADRPPELHGVGAPQTVEQEGLFGGAVRWAASPGVPDHRTAGWWRSFGARSVAEAQGGGAGGGGRGGPVHLNLAFREPLLGQAEGMPAGRADGRPWHQLVPARPVEPPADLVARLARGGRGVIVAGAGAGDPAAVHALAGALGWPVFADPRSGARIPAVTTVAAADALLRVPALAAWHPEVVLRLGRPWASRVLGGWLAGLPPSVTQVLVDPEGAWSDPDRVATTVVGCDPTALCQAVVGAVGGGGAVGSEWLAQWAVAEAAAQGAFDAALADRGQITEPGVARAVAGGLPDGATLFTSSSMPVRDLEWYGAPRPGLRVLANRGANGIDGVTSTAIGAALSGGPVVALLGDLAFLYDAGALLWAAGRRLSLTLVVVDNDGGGIFSFLPQAAALSAEVFERLWATPHGTDLAAVAAAYGIPVTSVEQPGRVAGAVVEAVGAGGVRVVLVHTDRGLNVDIHDELNQAVANAISNRFG